MLFLIKGKAHHSNFATSTRMRKGAPSGITRKPNLPFLLGSPGNQSDRLYQNQNILVQVTVHGCLTILLLAAYVALSMSALAALLAGCVVLKTKRKEQVTLRIGEARVSA
jgi:hypothetical protein